MAVQDEQKLDIHNYHIASFDILYSSGGATSVPPSMVISMSKFDDYDNNYFPLFNVKFQVGIEDYYKIIKEKTTVKFRLRLQKSKMDKYETTKQNVMKSDIFNEVFTCYISDSTPFYDEKIHKQSKEIRGTKDSKAPEDIGMTMDLFLFKEKDIEGSKKVVNKVLGGLTLTDMVFDLYSSCGLTSNFLMQKFDNNSRYSEIVIPALPMLSLLDYLQATYNNFYNGSAVIFFDFGTKYLLKKQVGCSAWRSQEYKQTVFMVREGTSAQKQQVSCQKVDKEKKYYISVTPDMVSIDKSSITSDVMDASSILIVDGKSGSSSNVKIDLDKRGSGYSKVVYQDISNSRVGQELKADITSKGMSVIITCDNIDMEAIAPNKEFILKFLDKQVGADLSGSYRLGSVSYKFIKNGSGAFNLQAVIKLTK